VFLAVLRNNQADSQWFPSQVRLGRPPAGFAQAAKIKKRLGGDKGCGDAVWWGKPSASDKMSNRVYLPQVDGLRFLAALLVLLSHFRPLVDSFGTGSVAQLAARIQQFGWIGVDIFLVLSSFLICLLLDVEKSIFGSIDIGRFYIRRLLRIWPLYFPYFLIAMFWLSPKILPPEQMKLAIAQHFLPFMTFTGNLSYNLFTASLSPLFAHLWTISLEEQFYVLVPVLAFFSAAFRNTGPLLVAAGLAFSFAVRWYVLANGIVYPTVWVFPLCRLDPFLIGGVCAWLYRTRPAAFAARALAPALLAAAILGFALVLSFPGIGSSIHTSWQLLAVALSAGCLVMATLPQGPLARLFASPVLAFLGKISFGIYVYHQVALWCTNLYFEPVLLAYGGWGWLASLSLTLLVVVGMSAASYLLWERRFLTLKARFERVRSRPA
jgi:peptidoglycan/LPS O-acetylase OafA/YrhL